MRNRLVLWGTNAQDERVLITMELLLEENKVDVRTYSEAAITDEVHQMMMDQWRVGEEVALPTPLSEATRELTMTADLLPEDIRVERSDLIQRAQTEWHYTVLSSKLSESYRSELEEVEERISKADRFDTDIWDSLKQFWGKVQGQLRDRTLLREHGDELRDRTNKAFDQMKALRKNLDEEFTQRSRETVERFQATLGDLEKQIEEGLHLNRVFNDLRDLQQKFRSAKFTKEHRNSVWNQLDAAFKAVKAKRHGGSERGGNEGSSGADRTQSRLTGLVKAIEKMERSIERDESDLVFENRRIASTDGQLEAQIRQAKIQMIQARIDSKREKLADMHKTQNQLEQRIKKQQEREARQAEQERIRQAEAAAKERIAQRIQNEAEARQEDDTKLADAAAAITGLAVADDSTADSAAESAPEPSVATEQPPAATEPSDAASSTTAPEPAAAAEQTTQAAVPSTPDATSDTTPDEEDSLLEVATEAISDSLTDVVDTVKAVAGVVGERIQEGVEELRDRLANAVSASEEEE